MRRWVICFIRSAIDESRVQVTTDRVIRSDTFIPRRSAPCSARPNATSRSEMMPSTVLPSLETMIAPTRKARSRCDNVLIVSSGRTVKTSVPLTSRTLETFMDTAPFPVRWYIRIQEQISIVAVRRSDTGLDTQFMNLVPGAVSGKECANS